jgi:hypothetical protein
MPDYTGGGNSPIQFVRTRSALKRAVGGRDKTYPFLENLTWDVVQHFDDFLGDEIRGSSATPGLYKMITGVDGAINTLTNKRNGVAELRASDGAGADNEYAGFSLPGLGFTGEADAVMAVRLAIDAITTVKVEVGFTDVTTDIGAVNDKTADPQTFTAANAAVWILDTDDNVYWEGMGVKAGTAATTVEAGISPVAATFETLVVALRDDNAKYIRLNADGLKTYESDWQTSAITAATALSPWIFIQLRDGTIDRNVSIDFIDVRGRRVKRA